MLRRLQARSPELDTCTYCPKLCRYACPVAEASGRETFTPWGLMSRGALIQRGLLPMDQATAVQWSHCTGCGRCTAACKHEIPVAEIIREARAEAAEGGLVAAQLKPWAQDHPPARRAFDALPEGGDLLILPGRASGAVCEAAVALLEARGVGPLGRPLGDVFTAGWRWAEIGYPERWEAACAELARAVQGAREIICLDGSEIEALRRHWPAAAPLGMPVTSLAAALGVDFAATLTPVIAGDARLSPCCRHDASTHEVHLQIIRALISGELHTPPAIAGHTGCCGAGAGLPEAAPEVARQVAVESVAVDPWQTSLSAAPIITTDPVCGDHLQISLSEQQVLHWAPLAAQAAGLDTREDP